MTIRLLSPISVAGVAKSIGDIITGDPAWEADQVNANNAVYTHRDLVQGEGLVPAQFLVKDGQVTGLVGPDKSYGLAAPAAGLMRLLVIGDSFTAVNSYQASITALTRANNVVTATCTGHGRGTGEIVNIYNCADATFNAMDVEVTRVDANTFTYPSIGADGSCADLAATKTRQIQAPAWANDNGYLFWLQSKVGGALKMVRNAGRSGWNSGDMLAGIDTLLAGAEYDAVIVNTGYNDFAAESYTAAQVYANVVSIVDKLAGRLVIVLGAMPWTTGGDGTDRKEAIKYNRLLRAYCNSRQNVRYADAAKYLVDPMNATAFSPATGMLQSDGIHPSPKGAERIAQAIYDVIQYDYPRVSRLVSCSKDNYGADNTSLNILDAAPWTNTGGALAGGATGTAASGVAVTNTGSGTTVASCPARSDGYGYDQQVVFTPAANNDTATISGAGYITGRTSDGNILDGYFGELVLSGMSGANIKAIDIYLTFASANSYHYVVKSTATDASRYPATDMTINLASLVESVICDGHTGIGWTVAIKAGAAGTALTAKLGRQSIEKLS